MRGCVWPCGRLQPLIGDRRSPHTRGFALAGASARVEHPQALAGSLSVCLSHSWHTLVVCQYWELKLKHMLSAIS